MKVLVTRTDRLGDVMLSLPTLRYLSRELGEITFLCRREMHDLLRPQLAEWGITVVDDAPFKAFDAVLFLFAPAEMLYRARKEKVSVRVGSRSKAASWLWLTKGVVQRRSRGERSEAVYNLELGRALLKALGKAAPEPGEFRILLKGTEGAAREAEALLGTERPVVVHPGMGGSALNPTPERYVEILSRWAERPLVLTVGPSPWDRLMAEGIRKLRPEARELSGMSLPVLAEVFRRASLVIAPSTGPLHLAHYVGAPTVGLYPPVRSQRPERWAPWGGAGKSLVLYPEVDCPGKRQCLGSTCPHYPCLEKLDWRGLLSGRGGDLISTV